MPREAAPSEGDDELRRTDPLGYYRAHYDGLTRYQLFQCDGALYQQLRRAGLLHQIPKKERESRTGRDPVAYYQAHYASLTRGQLQQADASIYQRLRRGGLLEVVPKKKT